MSTLSKLQNQLSQLNNQLSGLQAQKAECERNLAIDLQRRSEVAALNSSLTSIVGDCYYIVNYSLINVASDGYSGIKQNSHMNSLLEKMGEQQEKDISNDNELRNSSEKLQKEISEIDQRIGDYNSKIRNINASISATSGDIKTKEGQIAAEIVKEMADARKKRK